MGIHVNHVKQVLSKQLEYKLYVKGEKCEIHVPQSSLLGYIISKKRIIMDQTKVNVVPSVS